MREVKLLAPHKSVVANRVIPAGSKGTVMASRKLLADKEFRLLVKFAGFGWPIDLGVSEVEVVR
jgi:hypothetical protein